jgi:2-polyprenyl-6-methoxyphenol hydroxylase-like FAD-dependent oxidoreductase
MTDTLLDAVIIGGGLVGGLSALLLAQGGVQATVLDAAPILDPERVLAQANSTENGRCLATYCAPYAV